MKGLFNELKAFNRKKLGHKALIRKGNRLAVFIML